MGDDGDVAQVSSFIIPFSLSFWLKKRQVCRGAAQICNTGVPMRFPKLDLMLRLSEAGFYTTSSSALSMQ
ncbi:MAG TPA: hypothetical protein VF888_05400 [Nitrospirota bacterium]